MSHILYSNKKSNTFYLPVLLQPHAAIVPFKMLTVISRSDIKHLLVHWGLYKKLVAEVVEEQSCRFTEEVSVKWTGQLALHGCTIADSSPVAVQPFFLSSSLYTWYG